MHQAVLKTRAGSNYLTEKEEKQLFGFMGCRCGYQVERDYVLLKLMRATGLRRSEVTALNMGDVWGKDKIVVDERIAAKGAVGEVYLPKEIRGLLRTYLRGMKRLGHDVADDAPLFVSRKGNRLSLRSINDLVAKWCKEAGIGPITPHGFRHTKARRILDDRRFLSEEQQRKAFLLANRQLRHKSLNSTAIYTAPTKEDMSAAGAI